MASLARWAVAGTPQSIPVTTRESLDVRQVLDLTYAPYLPVLAEAFPA